MVSPSRKPGDGSSVTHFAVCPSVCRVSCHAAQPARGGGGGPVRSPTENICQNQLFWPWDPPGPRHLKRDAGGVARSRVAGVRTAAEGLTAQPIDFGEAIGPKGPRGPCAKLQVLLCCGPSSS